MQYSRLIIIARAHGGFDMIFKLDSVPIAGIQFEDTDRGRRSGRDFFAAWLPEMLPARIPWRHVRTQRTMGWTKVDRDA